MRTKNTLTIAGKTYGLNRAVVGFATTLVHTPGGGGVVANVYPIHTATCPSNKDVAGVMTCICGASAAMLAIATGNEPVSDVRPRRRRAKAATAPKRRRRRVAAVTDHLKPKRVRRRRRSRTVDVVSDIGR